jgi:hypothetical protein
VGLPNKTLEETEPGQGRVTRSRFACTTSTTRSERQGDSNHVAMLRMGNVQDLLDSQDGVMEQVLGEAPQRLQQEVEEETTKQPEETEEESSSSERKTTINVRASKKRAADASDPLSGGTNQKKKKRKETSLWQGLAKCYQGWWSR